MNFEVMSEMNSQYNSVDVAKSSVQMTERVSGGVNREGAVLASQNKVIPSNEVETESKGGAETGKQKKERAASEASIDDAVKSANRKMDKTRCEYSYHKETNRVSIRVMDAETNEVIREIPPEKSLDMLQKMWEMAGILVDEKR